MRRKLFWDKKWIFLFACNLIFLLSTLSLTAFAYNEPLLYTTGPSGPHGGFITTSQKCYECHAVHRAGSSFKLMKYSTVLYNCRYCHDPTFGADSPNISQRGVVFDVVPGAKSGHNEGMEGGKSVPGGSRPLSSSFSCSSCHSPHANPARIIEESYWFKGDGESEESSHLILKDAIQSSEGRSFYGSGFCANCHNRRHNKIAGLSNHPVSLDTPYNNVWYWDGSSYKQGSLANSNKGFSLLDRLNVNDKDPICQQCHEDTRDIVFPSATQPQKTFKIGTNPRYIAFPHETENEYMIVEKSDDLCLNCHLPEQLP